MSVLHFFLVFLFCFVLSFLDVEIFIFVFKGSLRYPFFSRSVSQGLVFYCWPESKQGEHGKAKSVSVCSKRDRGERERIGRRGDTRQGFIYTPTKRQGVHTVAPTYTSTYPDGRVVVVGHYRLFPKGIYTTVGTTTTTRQSLLSC